MAASHSAATGVLSEGPRDGAGLSDADAAWLGDEHSAFLRSFALMYYPSASAEEIKGWAELQRMAKVLLHIDELHVGHGRSVRSIALSPSDHEYSLALAALSKLMPGAGETQYRCPPEEPNLMSIAIHLAIGETSILLGADLEQHADKRRGWTAVLGDATLPKARSTIFKIPHHGSESSFSPDVWTELLVKEPLAVTTPWVRGNRHLPSAPDIARIVGQTPHAFISSMPVTGQSTAAHSAMVTRQLREMGVRINRIGPRMGAVRLRNGGVSAWHDWNVTVHEAARRLTSGDAMC